MKKQQLSIAGKAAAKKRASLGSVREVFLKNTEITKKILENERGWLKLPVIPIYSMCSNHRIAGTQNIKLWNGLDWKTAEVIDRNKIKINGFHVANFELDCVFSKNYRIWVKEPWHIYKDSTPYGAEFGIEYLADGKKLFIVEFHSTDLSVPKYKNWAIPLMWQEQFYKFLRKGETINRPVSLFPKFAARLFLRVKDVFVGGPSALPDSEVITYEDDDDKKQFYWYVNFVKDVRSFHFRVLKSI